MRRPLLAARALDLLFARRARLVRPPKAWSLDLLHGFGLESFPKTSGSEGLHFYVPLNTPITFDQTKPFAHAMAMLLEQEAPDTVTSVMKKSLRTGKVFVDWSQNNGKKTTVAPYSLRGRSLPTVAAPRTWEELESPGLQQLRFEQVLERFHDTGDLLADLDPKRQVGRLLVGWHHYVDRLGSWQR